MMSGCRARQRPSFIYHFAFIINKSVMSTFAMSDLIVSVSGIRGIVGQSLTPEAACRFAAALGGVVWGAE